MPELLKRAIRLLVRCTTVGMRKGPHSTRYYMYTHLARHRCSNPTSKKVLSISHSEQLCRLLGFSEEQVTNTSYPEVSLLCLPFPDESFDYVVSDQVLEHVDGNPATAVNESLRVTKPGGVIVHTTVLMHPIHTDATCPNDYWRFTPSALLLLVDGKAETVDVGGWGNRFVWVLEFFGLRFVPVPANRWHPLHWIATKNEKNWSIVTWIVARKKA